jgi:hypothetical protein
MYFCRGSLPW